MILYTYDPKKRRKVRVGVIHDGVFKKPVDSRLHLFRKNDCYAIQFDVYEQLDGKVKGIEIIESDTGNRYYASLDTWESEGGFLDWGHGLQKYLELSQMEVL